jgi:hypothetical protein
VVAGNDRARRFYEREGWRDTGAVEHHARTARGLIDVPARRYERRVDCPDPTSDDIGNAVDALPEPILECVRAICAAHPNVIEEPAWTGVRWRTGSVAIAHLVMISNGWPPAYARAADTDGPDCVLTVRSARADVEALAASDGPYFAPAWGTNWTPSVLGIRLDNTTDWADLTEHIETSYRLATDRRRRSTQRRAPKH